MIFIIFLSYAESAIVMPNHRRLRYRFKLIPALVSALLVLLGVSLAQWQTRRAHEKEAIAALIQSNERQPVLDAAEIVLDRKNLPHRRIKLTGQFIKEWPLYIDNRPLHGVAGFYVLMPLKLDRNHQIIWVARGWQPRNPMDRTRMPSLNTPEGTVEIEGIIRLGMDRVMQLGAEPAVKPGAIVENWDFAAISKQSMLNADLFIVEQTSAMADGLVRDWPLPSSGADKHRAYAFQWYALSLMAIIFFVVTGFRREKISE
jgi:surfeit locus 1 family protein